MATTEKVIGWVKRDISYSIYATGTFAFFNLQVWKKSAERRKRKKSDVLMFTHKGWGKAKLFNESLPQPPHLIISTSQPTSTSPGSLHFGSRIADGVMNPHNPIHQLNLLKVVLTLRSRPELGFFHFQILPPRPSWPRPCPGRHFQRQRAFRRAMQSGQYTKRTEIRWC